jgi:hypothetical protein
MAEVVANKGQQFEDMVRERTANDTEKKEGQLAFLFGGEGAVYYTELVQELLKAKSAEKTAGFLSQSLEGLAAPDAMGFAPPGLAPPGLAPPPPAIDITAKEWFYVDDAGAQQVTRGPVGTRARQHAPALEVY